MAGLVRITDPALHPLAGRWTETQEKRCGNTVWSTPARPIGEVVFNADGTFTVTVQPFESYHDYWGTYRYKQGSLTLEATGGNKLPSVRLAEGTAQIDPSGVLQMEGLLPADANSPQLICARRFRRE